MSAKVTSLCCTFVLIAACSGGAGQATNLRGGPDGIPNSSTDSPGNGYEPPGSSNQDGPGNSNQDSPGGNNASTCLDCSGVYSCVVPGATQNGTSLLGLVPATGGCGVIDHQGGSSSATLVCGGAITFSGSTDNVVETWSGGTGRFTVTVTENGQTIVFTCVSTNQSLPASTTVTGSGGTTDVDAG
jgi:hypothetical protein